MTDNVTLIDSLQAEIRHSLEKTTKSSPADVQGQSDAYVQTEAVEAAATEKIVPFTEGVPAPVEKPAILSDDTEESIINHPALQREEELVMFKEKYIKLVEEKLLIDKELASLRENYQQYKNQSLTHLLMYLAPIFALIAYLFIHYIKQEDAKIVTITQQLQQTIQKFQVFQQ